MPKPFTWSYSRLKNYETCPRRHYHYDIAKDVVEPETPALAEGSAVHKALELRVRHGRRLPLGMTHYEPLMRKLVNLPGEIYAEQKLALTEKFEPVGYFGVGVWFRTVLDFCAIRDSTAAVVDYKTGKPQADTTQIELLAATVMHSEPQVEHVNGRLLFINHNHAEVATYTRDDIPEIWGRILPRVQRLKEAVEAAEYPPKPGGLCKRYCAVTSCPYHGRGSMG